MNKTLLGDWGTSLEDDAYAQAVAGLGVLESDSLPVDSPPDARLIRAPHSIRWRGSLLNARPRRDFQQVSIADPAVAIECWRSRSFQLVIPSEILLWPGLRNTGDLLEVLARANPISLVVEPEVGSVPNPQRTWSLPLRIGVLSANDLQKMNRRISAEILPWSSRHRDVLRVEQLGEYAETADLLLYPAENTTLPKVRATVVVIRMWPPNYRQALHRAWGARLRFQASVVVLVPVPDGATDGFTVELLQRLVQNRTVEQAIRAGLRAAGVSHRPWILGASKFVDSLSLQGIANRYDEMKRFFRPARPPLGHSGGHGFTEAATPPERNLGSLTESLELTGDFTPGSTGALTLAEELQDLEADLDLQRTPRWLHANAYSQEVLSTLAAAGATAPPISDAGALEFHPHGALLAIQVSPRTTGLRAPDPVPEQQLEFVAGAVLLHVLVEIAGADLAPFPETPRTWPEILDERFVSQLPRTQLKTEASEEVSLGECPLELPEAGDSTLAVFWVVPHQKANLIRGRITLLYRNRAVQSIRFSARQTPETAGAASLEPDPQIRPRLDDLADMREFDATFLLADDLGVPPYVLGRRDGKKVQLNLSIQSLREPVESIVKALNLVTRRKADIDVLPLDSPLTTDALFRLASAGRLLYGRLPPWLASSEIRRIQVITRGERYFPAEFIYEGVAPDPTHSTICPQARAALTAGECGNCPHQRSSNHICPLHFWGLTRTIERHTFVSDSSDQSPVRSIPPTSPTRRVFRLPTPLLHGASEKAFQFDSRQACTAALNNALAKFAPSDNAQGVNTWNDWCTVANSGLHPRVFLALPHNEEFRGVSVLELGNGNLLSKAQIAEKALLGSTAEPRLLLLLGCSIAEPTEEFASYPQEFRARGADIVVAPLAPILGADCVPIATQIVETLAQSGIEDIKTGLGDVMSRVRRECLARGHPGVLGVVAYGDADWTFGK